MKKPEDKYRREVWRRLKGQQNVFLATGDGDQPRVRAVTVIQLRNRLFFATGSKSAKVKQIMHNPKIEFCLMFGKKGNRGTVRAQCIATIVNEKNIKFDVYSNTPLLGEFWKSPEDRSYTLIEFEPVSFEYYQPGSIKAKTIKL